MERGLSTGREWALGKKRIAFFNVLRRRETEQTKFVYLVAQS